MEVQNGFAFDSSFFKTDGDGLPIIRIRDLARGFSGTKYEGQYSESHVVSNGDYLIGMDGQFRCFRWSGGKALLNQRVCRLRRFNPDLLPDFVHYGINKHLQEIEDNTSFVTVKHLSSRQIENIEMEIPSLPEQERIVKLLDEADELQKLRAQADRRTQDLIPALFDEMFGDPLKNPKSFPISTLGAIAEVERGRFSPRPRNDPSYFGGVYPFIQTGDIAQSGGYLDSWTQTLNDRGVKVSKSFPSGTIVIAIVGATIGQTSILCQEVYATDSVIGIQPHQELAKVEYIVAVLRHWRPVFIAQAPATARANLNAATLKAVKIPMPPLPLQEEFAARVAEIREMEKAQAASRLRLEDLFQSMLHRAFNGEL